MSGIHIPWLGYSLIALSILGAIYWIYTAIKERQLVKSSENGQHRPLSTLQTNTSGILRVKQPKPSNRPPIAFNILQAISSVIILAFGVYLAYPLIIGKETLHNNLSWLLIVFLFIGLPIFSLVDIFFLERKRYSLKGSSVARHGEIIFKGDMHTVFDTCHKVLDMKPEKTSQISVIKPRLIQALIAGYMITISIRRLRNGQVKVIVESDSQWKTTKIDFWGKNQRNVDKIIYFICSEVNQPPKMGEAIKVSSHVYYEQAKLEIKNNGVDAYFTATARVIEGIVEPELYSMCWEPNPITPRHIDKDETATILVAEKAQQTLNAEWAEKAVIRGGIALFKSAGGKQEVFGASTMEQVKKRKLDERYPTMKTAYTLKDKCVIEVTFTSTPSLLEPFKRRYSLEIDGRGKLLFSELPTLDKEDSQT